MLKRQRPPTPPPLHDDLTPFPDRPIRPLPYRDAPPGLSSRECHSKRRRIHPPVLDGAQRGWAKPLDQSIPLTAGSDDGEDWTDGEASNSAAYMHSRVPASPDYTIYKRTNSILHEVHALHQHRLIFSQPNSQSPHVNLHPYSSLSTSPLSMATHQLSQSTHGICSSSSSSSDQKVSIPALPESPLPEIVHMVPGLNQSAAYTPLDFHEVRSVRERYEDINKLLGSLFLSRRRELQGGNPNATLITEEERPELPSKQSAHLT